MMAHGILHGCLLQVAVRQEHEDKNDTNRGNSLQLAHFHCLEGEQIDRNLSLQGLQAVLYAAEGGATTQLAAFSLAVATIESWTKGGPAELLPEATAASWRMGPEVISFGSWSPPHFVQQECTGWNASMPEIKQLSSNQLRAKIHTRTVNAQSAENRTWQ